MPLQQALSKEQIHQMKDEFLNLDQDGDGDVSIDELEKVLRSMRRKLRASEGEIQGVIKSVDLNGDGTVNLAEYYRSQKNKTNHNLIHRALVQRSKIRKEFLKFDLDNSGYITKEEMVEVMEARGVKISIDHISGMLQESDENDDGKIDYEEFVMLMTK